MFSGCRTQAAYGNRKNEADGNLDVMRFAMALRRIFGGKQKFPMIL